ncbi:Hypothetical protein HVR_LOCUS283 [uncultured virus]|nr:Hypothetical protein HVR_LOCUS283 [uncultured virus]
MVVSDQVQSLKTWLQDNNIKCDVTHTNVSGDFWGKIAGCISPTETTSYSNANELRPLSPIEMKLIFKFNMKSYALSLLDLAPFQLTKNFNNESITSFNITDHFKLESYKIGVYQREGFDEVYQSLKKLKPNLDKQTLACAFPNSNLHGQSQKWDLELVKREVYHGDEDCLFTETIPHKIPSGSKSVTIEFLCCDVASNLSSLKNFFQRISYSLDDI